MLTAGPALGAYFEQVARRHGDAKAAANWILSEVLAVLKSTGQTIDQFTDRPADLADLLTLVRDGVVSRTAAKQIFGVMAKTGEAPAVIAERDELLKVSGDAPLIRWIEEVVTEHPAEAARFRGCMAPSLSRVRSRREGSRF